MSLDQLVVAVLTIASGPTFWGFLQWARERKGEKAKAAKQQQAEEAANEQAEIDRNKLLADAQAVAQTTALESTGRALKSVTEQCDKCLEELHGLRDITGHLIDAIEGLMLKDDEESRAQARAAVRLARRAM
jgi:hypothetical protein